MKETFLMILLGLSLLVSVGITAQRTLVLHQFETISSVTNE